MKLSWHPTSACRGCLSGDAYDTPAGEEAGWGGMEDETATEHAALGPQGPRRAHPGHVRNELVARVL